MNNQTVIDTIMKYSKDCIVMRFTKNHLKKSMFLGHRCPKPFGIKSIDTIKIPLDELEMSLTETENNIAKLITPLFEGKDFNYGKDGKFSLSVSEMRDGYILLKEVSRRDPITKVVLSYKVEEHIILLRQLKSQSSDFSYSPGVLYKVGSGIREQDLSSMVASNEAIIANDLLNVIINKKAAYEYLE
jgi:hypothetical protein